MTAGGVIEARALTKTFGAHVALEGVSFEVAAGEVVGLLGLNGAGKTTTLRLLGGLAHPTSGSVRIAGHDMVAEPEATRAQIGFLPETPPLYPEMDVRSFLAFAARLRGMRGRLEAVIDAALSATDLLAHQHVPIGALSYGTQRRVGMAQAVIHRPALVLLDEPTSGLDPVQVVHMRQLIRSLRGRHTVIVSSHILSEISQLCDRILVLDSGQLAASGTEAELSARVATNVTIALEAQADPERLSAALATMPAVEHHSFEVRDAQPVRVLVDMRVDERAALVKHLVAHGIDIVGLGRTQLALESIFLRLMGQSHPETARPLPPLEVPP